MTEVFRKRVRHDVDRISIHQTHEINYWTKQFNCSADQLKAAVTAVGPLIKDVQKWLKENKH